MDSIKPGPKSEPTRHAHSTAMEYSEYKRLSHLPGIENWGLSNTSSRRTIVSASQYIGLGIQVIPTFQHRANFVSHPLPWYRGTKNCSPKQCIPSGVLIVLHHDLKKSKSVGARIMVLWSNHLEIQFYFKVENSPFEYVAIPFGTLIPSKSAIWKKSWACVTVVIPQLCVGLHIVQQFEVCYSFHQSHTNRVQMKPNLWTTLGEGKL